MNNQIKIKNIIKSRFSFLCTEFGATIVKEKTDRFGVYVTYKADNTGLRVSFEPREGGVFVMIFPLIDNEIPPYKNWHDIEDLLSANNVTFNNLNLTDNFNPDLVELDQVLKKYAENVQIYAYDFLKGNFEIIEDLELIVKKRKEEFKK